MKLGENVMGFLIGLMMFCSLNVMFIILSSGHNRKQYKIERKRSAQFDIYENNLNSDFNGSHYSFYDNFPENVKIDGNCNISEAEIIRFNARNSLFNQIPYYAEFEDFNSEVKFDK